MHQMTLYSQWMAKRPEKQTEFWSRMADRIRSAIDQSGLTPAELARRCGVTRAAVVQWADTGKISAVQIADLADAAGVDAEWLLTGKGGYSPEDRALLDQIKSLTDADRRRIQALADGLALTADVATGTPSDPTRKSA